MLALVNAPETEHLVRVEETPDPVAGDDEAVVRVAAFSLNRGELTLLRSRPEGWRPG